MNINLRPKRVAAKAAMAAKAAIIYGSYATELDDLLPNLVIVFEAFKRSQNLKAWLRFAPQRLQSSREARKKKENNFYLATVLVQSLLCGAERYKYFSVASAYLQCGP